MTSPPEPSALASKRVTFGEIPLTVVVYVDGSVVEQGRTITVRERLVPTEGVPYEVSGRRSGRLSGTDRVVGAVVKQHLMKSYGSPKRGSAKTYLAPKRGMNKSYGGPKKRGGMTSRKQESLMIDIRAYKKVVPPIEQPFVSKVALDLECLKAQPGKSMKLKYVFFGSSGTEVLGAEAQPPSSALRERFRVDEHFTGHVRKVDRQRGTFLAWLGRREDEQDLHEAEILVSEVAPPDQEKIAPGQVFYWVVGHFDVVAEDGRVLDRSGVSRFIFRAVSALDEQDVATTAAEARKLLARHTPPSD